jgi:hypothetical protein
MPTVKECPNADKTNDFAYQSKMDGMLVLRRCTRNAPMSDKTLRELIASLGGPETSNITAEILRRWQNCADAQSANSMLRLVTAFVDDHSLPKPKRLALVLLKAEMMHDGL